MSEDIKSHLTVQHVRISSIRYSKYMRRHLSTSFTTIQVDDSRRVNRVSLIRIDGHTKETRIRLKYDMNHIIIISVNIKKNMYPK